MLGEKETAVYPSIFHISDTQVTSRESGADTEALSLTGLHE